MKPLAKKARLHGIEEFNIKPGDWIHEGELYDELQFAIMDYWNNSFKEILKKGFSDVTGLKDDLRCLGVSDVIVVMVDDMLKMVMKGYGNEEVLSILTLETVGHIAELILEGEVTDFSDQRTDFLGIGTYASKIRSYTPDNISEDKEEFPPPTPSPVRFRPVGHTNTSARTASPNTSRPQLSKPPIKNHPSSTTPANDGNTLVMMMMMMVKARIVKISIRICKKPRRQSIRRGGMTCMILLS
jgi:hypothetical protein